MLSHCCHSKPRGSRYSGIENQTSLMPTHLPFKDWSLPAVLGVS